MIDSSRNSSEIALFCIPHAGGSAAYYAKFKPYFSEPVCLHLLELTGRGRRRKEPLKNNLDHMCQDLLPAITPVATSSPYAFFGHSMGALLAFLCTLHLHKEKASLPKALFLSACPPPRLFVSPLSGPVKSLSADERWRHIVELGNVPEELKRSREFRRYLEPILYADFTAIETWIPGDLTRLAVPITVFLGDQDSISTQTAEKWGDLTSREFSIRTFPGNHFYLQNHWPTLAAHIKQTLSLLP